MIGNLRNVLIIRTFAAVEKIIVMIIGKGARTVLHNQLFDRIPVGHRNPIGVFQKHFVFGIGKRVRVNRLGFCTCVRSGAFVRNTEPL